MPRENLYFFFWRLWDLEDFEEKEAKPLLKMVRLEKKKHVLGFRPKLTGIWNCSLFISPWLKTLFHLKTSNPKPWYCLHHTSPRVWCSSGDVKWLCNLLWTYAVYAGLFYNGRWLHLPEPGSPGGFILHLNFWYIAPSGGCCCDSVPHE